MTPTQACCKRGLDLVLAALGLLALGWLIVLCAGLARLSTGASGFFRQQRVGRHGRLFWIVKLRTMRPSSGPQTTVTAQNDPRITRFGAFLRRCKLDELPQLWNVLRGEMSLVGPRPDVPGFADQLQGPDRAILQLRPGITGPAALAFRHEEALLQAAADPERLNAEVLFPAKVDLNLSYLHNYTLRRDIVYILATFLPCLRARVAPPFVVP